MSYNKEQATGTDGFNILTVAMRELNTDFDGAMAWVVQRHKDLERRFLEGLTNLPSFGRTVDEGLQVYLTRIAKWLRGMDSWSFESARYFGARGSEYQRTRLVPLLPKRGRADPARRLGLVEVPLVENLEQGCGAQQEVVVESIAAIAAE